MTHLRKMMLEELQRRNYSEITTNKYLQYVTAFARHFGKSPDQLGPNELRSYQAYLRADGLIVSQARHQSAIDDLEDGSFRLTAALAA